MVAVSRRFQRQRQDSYRSSESLTPADELSSWLGDDVCTNCGAPARANLLYCSQQCKDEDAQDGRKSRASTSAPTFTQYNYPKKDIQSWRYPCPQSPNLTAKHESSLTSPALVALERTSSTSSVKGNATLERDEASISSSDDGSSAATEEQDKKRRSSSQSTFSTASDATSTDRSTPSSAALALYDDVEDDDSFEPSKLVLPPSVHPAASILLNSASREVRNAAAPSSSITLDGVKRSSPSQSSSLAASNQAGIGAAITSNKADSQRKTLDFARRPSSTNLPAPVLFTSPTITKAGSASKDSSRHKSSNAVPINVVTQKDNLVKAGKISPSTVPALTASPTSKRYLNTFIATINQMKGSIDSPPGIPSVSSSAGRTLRGISPAHSTSPGFGICQGAVCGRYGCNGLGSSVESITEEEEKHLSSPRRPALNRTHKHTHSAAAGLNYLAQGVSDGKPQSNSLAARSKLLMTPVLNSNSTFGNSQNAKAKESTSVSNEQGEILKSPPRGRSKARGGRRSSSRRSPSPPRGVARRGHSQDLNTLSRNRDQDSPSISPNSARSNPIAIGLDQISPNEEKRGRSPTEKCSSQKVTRKRDEARNDSVTLAKVARQSCEMAWPAYGHDLDASGDQGGEFEEQQRAILAKRAAKAVLHGANGYDDVDLDEL